MTAQIARAAFPDSCLGMRLRDALGPVFSDDDFVDLFPRRGQPALSPGQLALVCILQFAEGLSDRQAATAVRDRIGWKYALGLELTDPGFDFSVLCEFRARLITGKAERRVLDRLLELCRDHNLLGNGGAARTDSTHVLGAVRVLNRLELVGETVRAALNALAVAAPRWLGSWMPPVWADRYGHRVENHRLPQTDAGRLAFATAVGSDGAVILAQVDAGSAPAALHELEAVHVLRAVWLQQYDLAANCPRWRVTEELPPSQERIASPYDVECRYAIKRTTKWTGYKSHLTEHCGPDRPHLVINVETTDASQSDQNMIALVHGRLDERGLLPDEHLADTGYMAATTLLDAARDHGVRLIGPMPPDTSWQAKAREGFDVTAFVIDWQGHTAVCPQGAVARRWRQQLDSRGHPVIRIRFPDQDCAACPVRNKCTRRTSEPRDLVLRPQAQHETLQRHRQEQGTAAWQESYGRRAGVEGTISQAISGPDIRHARYRGLAKVQLQQILSAAALNLLRIDAWLTDTPLAQTRTSRLEALPTAA
ncbi:IS1182 family transposase [Streptomyces sp. NPDC004539]|uniref:IS1182 family transposase n=1 Tax=Streptomyces sp. NPDC004539 TaxID=3154280 RepID=UPI0033BCFACD